MDFTVPCNFVAGIWLTRIYFALLAVLIYAATELYMW